MYINATIERFVDPHQPGFVECSIVDAWNRKHLFIDKIPVVAIDDLDENSSYPQPGVIACEILKEWTDAAGREIISVTTERPWAIESNDGQYEFDIPKDLLTTSAAGFP